MVPETMTDVQKVLALYIRSFEAEESGQQIHGSWIMVRVQILALEDTSNVSMVYR